MIVFNYETDFILENESHIKRWISNIIQSYNFEEGEINYIFCDDDYLLQLNIEFLNHDTLTDIISFDYTLGRLISGDIFISVPRVQENAKKFNIPTKNDIGQTICKDSELSEHTGYIVMGRNTYNKVQGVVVASLEDFSTNGSNLKINIKGWLSDRNQIGSGSNVLYKQTPLESGRVIWDNKQGWFKCNY